ncbi:2-dehydro-3-deoxy-D-gluconate 5-dehydrogenase KduD [Sedimentitalea sp. JM2-8]|uniref:2-dehydro-3-deoxy-D-gluconate 5-dehydrogenase KduD n=2 Tax=Sedimentitalea xiamensis TaxID=3050037 RepID=A0ABT7FGT4_9RHOB|nr:2-dehydro-3-deoxy-D-gluconate 5-dehydrogenase KduD [Sedimentitalea xiamensis]MDK3074350.1 2-dehydro-3-deoxy-D-gluconate 5-dehydrogenase KduD [Sedimentitalea xiamensis]
MFDLTDRVAIITGANTGIGQAIAVGLSDAGARVALVGRSPMNETRGMLDGDSLEVTADLSSMDAIPCIVSSVLDWAGQIDILVNNAGIIRRADAIDFTEEDWDAVMDINLKNLFFLSQAVARHMLPRGRGKIVNIASLLSFQGGIRVPSYTASKSGVAGLTRLLACEWAGQGVNVNAVAPGYIATNNTVALRQDPVRNRAIRDRIPAGDWGRPEQIAGAVVFLASDAAEYVNGVVLPVDGGWLAR